MKRSVLAASAGLRISKKGNSEPLNAADEDRVSPFTAIRVISLIAALGALASLTVHAEDDQMGGPGQKPDLDQTQNWPAGPAMKDSISGQLSNLTSRISRLEIAIKQMRPADSSMEHEMQSKATGQSMEQKGMGTMQEGVGMEQGGIEMADMEKMMQSMMGGRQTKDLYPTLMSLPNLSPEMRAQVEAQAQQRMEEGVALMSRAAAALTNATAARDYASMESGASQLREGVAEFDSSVAILQALNEAKSPQQIALRWFKTQMNLVPVAGLPTPGHRILGLSLLHFFVMLALTAFFVAMVWMYFFKMRRAAQLLRHLAGAPAMSSTADAGHIGSPASLTAAVAPSVAPLTPTVPGPAPPAPFQKAAGGSTASEVAAAAGARASAPWTGQLRVARIFDETPTVKTYRLANPGGGDLLFTFEPGQFMTVALTVQGKLTRRSYSIASSPCCRGWCEISVKRAPNGVVSGYLHEHVREGNLLDVVAPSGRFTFRGVEASSVVFVAGGIGITPLMSAVRYLTDQSWQGEIYLLYACARMEEVIFREELELLQRRHANLYSRITLSHEDSAAWTGERGFITKELLTKTVPALTSRRVHLCGSPRMLDAVKALLTELGVPAGQMYTEIFLGPVAGRAPAAPPAEKVLGGAPLQAQKTAVCTFVRSRKTAALPPNKTVLEASEEVGVDIDYSCREGYCGTCKVRLLAGEVTMAVEDGLTPEDKAAHIILACQAKSKADMSIDA